MTITDSHLSHVTVGDVMHTGILTTDPSTPLRTVARLMAAQRVHAVAVADPEYTRRPRGFISAQDIVAAAAHNSELTAGQAAATEVVAVSVTEPIEGAAQLMTEHAVSHLIVTEPTSGHPVGIISSLDIAQAYGD